MSHLIVQPKHNPKYSRQRSKPTEESAPFTSPNQTQKDFNFPKPLPMQARGSLMTELTLERGSTIH